MSSPSPLKLYLVILRGLANSTGVSLKTSYVVAENSDDAYRKVRQWLDEKDYGFKHERELQSVELLASSYEYTDVRTRLFL